MKMKRIVLTAGFAALAGAAICMAIPSIFDVTYKTGDVLWIISRILTGIVIVAVVITLHHPEWGI